MLPLLEGTEEKGCVTLKHFYMLDFGVYNMMEQVATILGVLGAILNANKRKEGFYAWIAGNTLLVYINYTHKLYWLSVLFIIYIIICIWGLVKWRE